MHTYLLTFKQGKKIINAWHEANNAGEAIGLLEDIGIDVIKTIKVKSNLVSIEVKQQFPDLTFMLKIMGQTLEYKELQEPQTVEQLVKIIL